MWDTFCTNTNGFDLKDAFTRWWFESSEECAAPGRTRTTEILCRLPGDTWNTESLSICVIRGQVCFSVRHILTIITWQQSRPALISDVSEWVSPAANCPTASTSARTHSVFDPYYSVHCSWKHSWTTSSLHSSRDGNLPEKPSCWRQRSVWFRLYRKVYEI